MINIFKNILKDKDNSFFINTGISEVIEGEINPIEAITILKRLETIIEEIKSDKMVHSIIEDEVLKYGKEEKPIAMGYEVTLANRRTYNFSNCGDEYLNEMKAKESQLKYTIKNREKFLQSLTQKVFDSENGGFEINPPEVKHSTFFTLKKQQEELPTWNI
jgi:hypothetical protein